MPESHIQPPFDAPQDPIHVGGLIQWFSISLSIRADDLDPDAVTRLLGIDPADAGRKGIPTVKGHPRRTGIWTIRIHRAETQEADLGHAISMLLDRVSASATTWSSARAGASARVNVGLRITGNQGFRLEAELLARLARLGLQLDFDVYAIDKTPK